MPEYHVSNTATQAIIIDEKGRTIAVVYDQADAPLLASAPELLAALEESHRCTIAVFETDHFPDDTCPADLLDVVIPVIAKAKGE